jgi:hypothetical protein
MFEGQMGWRATKLCFGLANIWPLTNYYTEKITWSVGRGGIDPGLHGVLPLTIGIYWKCSKKRLHPNPS